MNYWDLTEEERGLLTEAQMQTYCDYALMEAGVLKPTSPGHFEDNPPVLNRKPFYRVRLAGRYGSHLEVGFDSVEDAEDFIGLKPVQITNMYIGHQSVEYMKPVLDPVIERVELTDESEVTTHKTKIERYNADKSEHSRKVEEYEQSLKKAAKALEGIWENYRSCQATLAKLKLVRDTFDQYVTMTAGNKQMARSFLNKTFEPAIVEKALGPWVVAVDAVSA